MNRWTTDWPTTPGWYWTWIEGSTDHQTDKQDIQPTQVVVAGREPHTSLVYLRSGLFLYKSEQTIPMWWCPLDVPEGPT